MAKSKKCNQKQFALITARMHDELFGLEDEPAPVDCEALLAYIEAAQAVYARECPIARTATTAKKTAKKKAK